MLNLNIFHMTDKQAFSLATRRCAIYTTRIYNTVLRHFFRIDFGWLYLYIFLFPKNRWISLLIQPHILTLFNKMKVKH